MFSCSCFAHQPDISTSVFSKTKEGKHILQITSALTAFEGEIDFIYAKNAYKTPEEFKTVVSKYFEKNVVLIVNGNDTLKLSKPLVLLGHETKLVVEIVNMPNTVKSIYYKNQMFKDMPHNQMAVIMLTDDFPKEQYVLNNANNQSINLQLNQGVWENIVIDNQNPLIEKKYIIYLLLFVVLIVITIYFWRRKSSSKFSS